MSRKKPLYRKLIEYVNSRLDRWGENHLQKRQEVLLEIVSQAESGTIDGIQGIDGDGGVIFVGSVRTYHPGQRVEVYDSKYPFASRGNIKIRKVGTVSVLTDGLPEGTKVGDWLITYGTGS